MTLIVALKCSDGVVIAADSMLTTSSQHLGKKIFAFPNNHIYAFAGDLSLADRFRTHLEIFLNNGGSPNLNPHPLGHAITIRQNFLAGFNEAELKVTNLNVACCVVAFNFNDNPQVCIFLGAMHPRLLDNIHFYACLGSGEQYAGPFIAFLASIFCRGGPPTVREGAFLATWVLEHTIRTNAGGVNRPIRLATIARADEGFVAREHTDEEINDLLQAIDDATDQLVRWRDHVGGVVPVEENVPPVPVAP